MIWRNDKSSKPGTYRVIVDFGCMCWAAFSRRGFTAPIVGARLSVGDGGDGHSLPSHIPFSNFDAELPLMKSPLDVLSGD